MRLSIQIEFDKILDLETDKTTVTVGRNPACDMVVNNEVISRQHCKIELIEGKFYITDLGSSNGVFINSKRIAPNQKVAFGDKDTLSLGKLECELSTKHRPKDHTVEKIVSAEHQGDAIATIRLARIDLNREMVVARKLTIDPPKPRGPRNPITAPLQEKEEKDYSALKLIMIIALVVGAGYYYLKTK